MRVIKSSIENEFLLIMYDNGTVRFLNYHFLPFSKKLMKQHVYYILIYCRGHLYKGATIFDATRTDLQQNFCFNKQKCFCEHCHKVYTLKIP